MMVLLRSDANGMKNDRTATYRIRRFVSTIGNSLRPEAARARAPWGDDSRACAAIVRSWPTLFPSSYYGAAVVPRYCSSLTCSIQSTTVPLIFSAMAIWVMALSGAAPCQCFTPAGIQTTSPCRISSIGPPTAVPYQCQRSRSGSGRAGGCARLSGSGRRHNVDLSLCFCVQQGRHYFSFLTGALKN